MSDGSETLKNAKLLGNAARYRSSGKLKDNALLLTLSLIYKSGSRITIGPYTCLRKQVFLLAYVTKVMIHVARIKFMINKPTAKVSASIKAGAAPQAAVA